jgi:hypothetical protein
LLQSGHLLKPEVEVEDITENREWLWHSRNVWAWASRRDALKRLYYWAFIAHMHAAHQFVMTSFDLFIGARKKWGKTCVVGTRTWGLSCVSFADFLSRFPEL